MPRLPLDARRMRQALAALERGVDRPTQLVIGGGAAMVLAYGHRLATDDVDAFVARGGVSMAALDTAAREVARELGLQPDWLNSHFETFTAVLPAGYGQRLRPVWQGSNLRVTALGPEDLLLMKCFAGRDKDRAHALKLLGVLDDIGVVEARLAELCERRFPGADRAADYFDDLRDEVGV